MRWPAGAWRPTPAFTTDKAAPLRQRVQRPTLLRQLCCPTQDHGKTAHAERSSARRVAPCEKQFGAAPRVDVLAFPSPRESGGDRQRHPRAIRASRLHAHAAVKSFQKAQQNVDRCYPPGGDPVVVVRGNRVRRVWISKQPSATNCDGHIYLAKVTRVEPSLQAAFTSGRQPHGFLVPPQRNSSGLFQIPVADASALIEADEARPIAGRGETENLSHHRGRRPRHRNSRRRGSGERIQSEVVETRAPIPRMRPSRYARSRHAKTAMLTRMMPNITMPMRVIMPMPGIMNIRMNMIAT